MPSEQIATYSSKGLRPSDARDRLGAAIDLTATGDLLDKVVATWHPKQIWLFGSRARGNASPASDWDLLIVVPDDSGEELFEPLCSWQVSKDAGVRADLVPCRARDFEEDRSTPNTLAYDASANGVLLFEL
jgi:predicted nucleotidyltransferase